MYPPVRNYGDIDVESFDSYYERWPTNLSNIPEQVVRDWIYRHWHDFSEHWIDLLPDLWTYELREFTSDQILSIDHIGSWIAELDAEGEEFVGNAPRSRTRLAGHMLTQGTFPVPILIAQGAGQIIHPRSGGERMKQPYQLIEGHSRLACLRGMIKSHHPNLATKHAVWVAKIPTTAITPNPSLNRTARKLASG